ncbi:MAG TPA: Flp pilus assembly protein CpaB [Actinobacteria bacterium]|nr:Flp pilus assembly protein CpaB [Actinomycetota bacterium]
MKDLRSYSFISIASGVLAVFLTFAYLSLSRAADKQRLATEISAIKTKDPVVVAIRDIRRGTRLTEQDIGTRMIPRAYIAAGSINDERQALGREALEAIYSGEGVSSKRISGSKSKRASADLRAGNVALAVGIDEISGVAGGIRLGDRVDIFATEQEDGRTRLINEDVLVVGVGGVYPYGPEDAKKNSTSSYVSTGATVILELSRRNALKLTQASENGRLRLALRAADQQRGF